MSYEYRSGTQGSSSATQGAAVGNAAGKRTLTEQLPMNQGAPAAQDHGHAHAHDHDHAGEGPQLEGTGPRPEVQPPGSQSQPLTAAAAQQLLQAAFGSYKQMSAGQVRVLAQADFQAAYDAIYGTSPYAWATYVAPRFGNLNGFAYGGVNYINQNSANVTTVPHEMLHTNVAADWRGVVGSPFDEGATEYLEQHALRTGGIHTTLTHYPNERAVVEAYLAAGATQDALFRAYLVGGANSLVAQWVDQHCQGTWASVKTATESSQWAVARASLAPKASGTPAGGTPAGGTPAGGAPATGTPAAPAPSTPAGGGP